MFFAHPPPPENLVKDVQNFDELKIGTTHKINQDLSLKMRGRDFVQLMLRRSKSGFSEMFDFSQRSHGELIVSRWLVQGTIFLLRVSSDKMMSIPQKKHMVPVHVIPNEWGFMCVFLYKLCWVFWMVQQNILVVVHCLSCHGWLKGPPCTIFEKKLPLEEGCQIVQKVVVSAPSLNVKTAEDCTQSSFLWTLSQL